MNRLKEMLLSNWDLMRVLKLVIGTWMGMQGVMAADVFAGLAGAFFLYQAVTGTGCGVGGCYAPPRRQAARNDIQDIEYEEVK